MYDMYMYVIKFHSNCGGLAMCVVWMMAESPKTCSTESSAMVPELEVDPPPSTKTHASVTWEMRKSTSINAWEGLAVDRRAWKSAVRRGVGGPRPTAWSSCCRKEPGERRVLLARLPLGLCALTAPETATPALAYTATPESATLELPCAAIVFRDGRSSPPPPPPPTNYIYGSDSSSV